MNDKFNFSRFATYFKYDLTQMWRNHSRAAILIGGASAIFYFLWVMFSLVFTQTWSSPSIEFRVAVFLIASLILGFYMVYTYGHLTDKRAGSAWLMIPASRTEKFVSMLLVTIVVIPLLFFAVYMLLDGVISLLDPTYGKAIVTGLTGSYGDFLNAIADLQDQSFPISASSLVLPSILSVIGNVIYFVLCGICFKRNKLVYSILVILGVSVVLSMLGGIIMPLVFSNWIESEVTEEMVMDLIPTIMNIGTALNAVTALGLGCGVWYRIKTLQH